MSTPAAANRTEFYLTFGDQYSHEPHPTLPLVHPGGWLTIVAEDYTQARAMAVALLGSAWLDLYESQPDPSLYPRGELYRLEREKDGLRLSLPGHAAECWRHHDDCALQRAKEVLEARPTLWHDQTLLAMIRITIADHTEVGCPSPGECYGAQTARRLLDSSTPGATEFATGSHDRGALP